MNNIEYIVNKLKTDTNNTDYTTYREKYVCNKKVIIIYIDPLTSSDKISDFIIRSLDRINKTYSKKEDLGKIIENEIDNFKIKKITSYKDLCYHLNYGFTIILIEDHEYCFALETKRVLSRSISAPQTETALRGAMDAFVEDMHTNIGLIKDALKIIIYGPNLWI